jgi:hypothetical protein
LFSTDFYVAYKLVTANFVLVLADLTERVACSNAEDPKNFFSPIQIRQLQTPNTALSFDPQTSSRPAEAGSSERLPHGTFCYESLDCWAALAT